MSSNPRLFKPIHSPPVPRLDRGMAMVLRLAALLLRHWMRVVEADSPLAIRPVERERVAQPVRLLRRHPHPRPARRSPLSNREAFLYRPPTPPATAAMGAPN